MTPTPAYAVGAGGQCCPAGYQYNNNNCLSDQVMAMCSNFALNPPAFICSIPINIPVVGGISWCDVPGVRQAVVTACQGIIGPDMNAVSLAKQFCDAGILAIKSWILEPACFIPPAGGDQVCFSIPPDAVNGIIDPARTQCMNTAQAALEPIIGLQPVKDIQCDSGLTCDGAHVPPVCQQGLPPPFCSGNEHVWTALGCLDIRGKETIQQILFWAIGIGGGIAIIMIIIAAIQITTARGDAKRVQAGRELLFSVLVGVIMIVLAVVLLQFLGITVLGLGGLGFS